MTQRSSVGDGSSGLRAALGELLVRLRGSAVDGVVPEQVFSEGVKALVLGDAERERLRHELARLGLPVQELHVHTDGDKRNGEKVAQKRGESVFPRIRPVHNLIRRYVDADGYVTSHVLDGVVKLAGLQAHEAARLRAETPVRDPEAERGPERPKAEERGGGGVDEAGSSEGVREDGEDGREGLLGETEADEADRADLGGDTPAVETAPGDLAEALAAAYAVLDTDRRERRPGSRLLSAQAEVGLAVLTRGGADHIAREPDEDELKALPTDDLRIRARDCLVLHNQRLVHSLVRPHLEQGLDYDDLLQHGFLGLLRAARKFDPTKGFKFSTYATWWIRQSITRAIADEGALIRIPVHMHEQMRKVAVAERALAAEGRPASAADVAVMCDMTLQKVEEIRRLTRRTDSLDRVIGDGMTLGDFVGRNQPLPPVDTTVLSMMHAEEIMAVVNTFTGRDHRILVRRLGLDGDEPSTLDEVGREFGVTRERIRQLEVKLRPALIERLRTARVHGVQAVISRMEAEQAGDERGGKTKRRARRRTAPPPGGRTSEGTDAAVPAPDTPLTGVESGKTFFAPDLADGESAPVDAVPAADASDWERARLLARTPSGQSWLAEYALAAWGRQGLVELLGQSAGDAVLRIAKEREPADHAVLTTLEVLRRVSDAVAAAGLRPEDFLDWPATALSGATPRAYLVGRPLVGGESRLAVRDALREFTEVHPPRETEQRAEHVEPEAEHAEEASKPGVGERTEVMSQEAFVARAEVRHDAVVEPPAPEGTKEAVGDTADTSLYSADWEMTGTLTKPPFTGKVTWLAKYALLAVGYEQLREILGPPAADGVFRAARRRGTLNRHVVGALETLADVFDAVREAGLMPEHFFERPAEALDGETPRAYLAARPLVGDESRFAVREALREFVAAQTERQEPAQGTEDAFMPGDVEPRGKEHSAPPATGTGPRTEPSSEAADARAATTTPLPGDTDRLLKELRTRHEAELARVVEDCERRLAEERNTADECLAAARSDTERQFDVLEESLLRRVDRALERQGWYLQRQADERVAHLKTQHHEAYRTLLRRTEEAEKSVRVAEDRRNRTRTLELQLHQYREGAEARIAELETQLRQARAAVAQRDRAAEDVLRRQREAVEVRVDELEKRLRDAEAALAQRDQTLEMARRHAESTEQMAAQRVAQAEHNAWVQTAELQQKLAELHTRLTAAQEAAQARSSFRDRWRRS
ncbi:sigma-70 family RNA polymerase sigma factor [Streptomyces prasinus]|uniref:sigma-70 family RNA polymerase sigma factor n=1 Tax=Streptomyces prasinus TaxID=67345 RepID=UPI002F4245DB